ncbi:putative RNA methyltransferase [Aeromonas simiae]|uniref:putative RNA methyltransferase n=1 Tax=Aeromonas simiae TaxID=218936 RepID=UPI0005AAD967|nr:SAM-dependent methyltransferase [Aeromonas simiae]
MQLQCPLCRAPLHRHAASGGAYCDNKHHFDKAPEGYLDLIPGKHSPKEGESRALMRARRHWLESGALAPLTEAIADQLPAGGGELILLGCGEGYLSRALAGRRPDWTTIGIERAKNAVFAAAKAQPGAEFVLADPGKPPLLPGSATALLLEATPKTRLNALPPLLAPGGWLLLFSQGPRHHWQLRSHINPDAREHPAAWPCVPGLREAARSRCHFEVGMDQESRALMLATSPLAWRTNNAQRHDYQQHGGDHLEHDYLLTLWQAP